MAHDSRGRSLDASNATDDASPEGASAGRPPAISIDRAFELLSREHRRRVLYYLMDNEGAASIDDIAEHAAGASDDAADAAAVGLHHTHLPRLADAGVIDYDRDTERVSLAANADRLGPYLELAAREERADA